MSTMSQIQILYILYLAFMGMHAFENYCFPGQIAGYLRSGGKSAF
jgi:hypothetical protein